VCPTGRGSSLRKWPGPGRVEGTCWGSWQKPGSRAEEIPAREPPSLLWAQLPERSGLVDGTAECLCVMGAPRSGPRLCVRFGGFLTHLEIPLRIRDRGRLDHVDQTCLLAVTGTLLVVLRITHDCPCSLRVVPCACRVRARRVFRVARGTSTLS
jgi:hypothetical protein